MVAFEAFDSPGKDQVGYPGDPCSIEAQCTLLWKLSRLMEELQVAHTFKRGARNSNTTWNWIQHLVEMENSFC